MAHSRPHVVILHRWRETYARYAQYVNHETHAVTYVTTDVGADGIPANAADVRIVSHTDDRAEVEPAVRSLVAQWGHPVALIALKEDDLLLGGALREEYSLPGPGVAHLAPFRDKFQMCRRVADAGVAVPAFRVATSPADVMEHASRHGWPVILKPFAGSSAEGVLRVDSPAQLAAMRFPKGDYLAQVFVDQQIFHVDGVFDGQEIAVIRASAYLNNCLSFRAGSALGSVEEDRPHLVRAIRNSARECLAALTDNPTVFHLELFVDESTGACQFLEVGARVGGAEVPLVWREVHGIDLMAIAFDLQVGRGLRPELLQPAGHESDADVAGWLLLPAPAQRPCRITSSRSMLNQTPGPYAEAVLAAGDVLPDAEAYYEHVGGRFRFRGRSRAEVESAINATVAGFEVHGEALAKSA